MRSGPPNVEPEDKLDVAIEDHDRARCAPHHSLSKPWLVNLSVRLFSVTVRGSRNWSR